MGESCVWFCLRGRMVFPSFCLGAPLGYVDIHRMFVGPHGLLFSLGGLSCKQIDIEPSKSRIIGTTTDITMTHN